MAAPPEAGQSRAVSAGGRGTLNGMVRIRGPALCRSRTARFPYLVFYVPDDETLDIWRVLHARRDIPAFLAADPPS